MRNTGVLVSGFAAVAIACLPMATVAAEPAKASSSACPIGSPGTFGYQSNPASGQLNVINTRSLRKVG